MELVYLWVEDYKNIHKQGFNFSPRFECEFHDEYEKDADGNEKLKENCKLEIKEKKDYVDIFPENINVTAIVGENGSGKSNLLELISNIGYYENPYRGKEYPALFSELIQLTVYYDRLKNKLLICKKNLTAIVNNKSSITDEEITNESIQKILISPTPSHSQKEYLLLLDFLINNNIDFPFDIPETISFGIHDDYYDLLNLIENQDFEFHTQYSPFEEDEEKRFKIFHILLMLAYLKNYKIDFNIQASEVYDDTILELEHKISKNIKLKIRSFIKTPLEDFSGITDHYVNMKNIPKDFFKTYIEIIKRKNNNELLEFKGKKVFNFDFYPKMSDGQYQFTYIFNTIYSQINQDSIMLCIDEGENYLHPNWQKKYINYLHGFLKDNFPNKKIHLILTSHSPFLLSDLPKENVIFLDKVNDKTKEKYPNLNIDRLDNGNCIDVTKEIKINPFGANIHTLLSHGFFMQDGLMGEFAKGKIEEIKRFYERVKKLEKRIQSKSKTKTLMNKLFEKRKERFGNVQKIIGEPFLQTIIGNYLDELYLILSDDETLIDKELHRLEERRKYLEGLKSD